MPLHLSPSFREALAASERALIGMWGCAGSSVMTEIAAGSGLDWLLIDMEHSANTLDSVQSQLRVASQFGNERSHLRLGPRPQVAGDHAQDPDCSQTVSAHARYGRRWIADFQIAQSPIVVAPTAPC